MSLEQALHSIKSLGGRMTKCRRAILEILEVTDSPLSAADILLLMKDQRISANRTTIYRELAYLTEHDVISEIQLLGKPSMFEKASGHRHHLICKKCDVISSIQMKEDLEHQERQIEKEERFKITGHALAFYGICKDCQR